MFSKVHHPIKNGGEFLPSMWKNFLNWSMCLLYRENELYYLIFYSFNFKIEDIKCMLYFVFCICWTKGRRIIGWETAKVLHIGLGLEDYWYSRITFTFWISSSYHSSILYLLFIIIRPDGRSKIGLATAPFNNILKGNGDVLVGNRQIYLPLDQALQG